jgi:sugar phosphate isomerase/epimerase
LPAIDEAAKDPDAVRKLLEEHGVELVCLSTPATLDTCSRLELDEKNAVIEGYLELASHLGCSFVRISAGRIQGFDHRRAALARITEAVASLVPVASRHRVTLLIENGGDFSGSEDLWHVVDAVGHPSFQCCWSQCRAMTVRERPTTSIPRLGSKIGLLHLCDAEFNGEGGILRYVSLGRGEVEVARQIELLKGLVYEGYLVFEWPKTTDESLPEPEEALPEAAEFLRKQVEAEQEVLSAYKGDKRPAKFASRADSSASSS